MTVSVSRKSNKWAHDFKKLVLRAIDYGLVGAVRGVGRVRRFGSWRFRYATSLGVIVTSSQPCAPASLRMSTGRVFTGRSFRLTVTYSHSGIVCPRKKPFVDCQIEELIFVYVAKGAGRGAARAHLGQLGERLAARDQTANDISKALEPIIREGHENFGTDVIIEIFALFCRSI
jgi:hypothetical protein